LLLLLLLAVDWAADPCQGTSPLSRPLASTICYCHSTRYRDSLPATCEVDDHGQVQCSQRSRPGNPPCRANLPSQPCRRATLALCYLFMVLLH
jgi:hypothetical protein